VVEDNRDSADSLRTLLELIGYDVTVAYDGLAGVKAAKQLRPHAVVSDLGLPGMDGFAVAMALRGDPATARTPLIALTGYGRDAERQHSQEAGFNYHLVKPVDPRILEAVLASCGAGREDGDGRLE
jgi:CheY-like chemotaxis protein